MSKTYKTVGFGDGNSPTKKVSDENEQETGGKSPKSPKSPKKNSTNFGNK